ncbi:hypothetical protein Mapa_001031 [Marchantia paleacea]|nr:hypothetical protein Mapa_001031 [Marchantia paleacea]
MIELKGRPLQLLALYAAEPVHHDALDNSSGVTMVSLFDGKKNESRRDLLLLLHEDLYVQGIRFSPCHINSAKYG